MKNSPWAKLISRATPSISASPAATMAYIAPRVAPCRSCSSRSKISSVPMLLVDLEEWESSLHLTLHHRVLVAAHGPRLRRDLLLHVLVELLQADDAVAIQIGCSFEPVEEV